jgi:type IV pilus assembly protein PilF
MNIQLKIFRRIILAALTLGLVACISTTSSVFTGTKNDQEAMAAQVKLARSYMGKGNWELAKRKLKIAHDMAPEAPEVHEALALVSQNTGEYELAEYHFKRALSFDPDFSRARNNYAAFLYNQERVEEACTQLEKVVTDPLYESRARGFFNLALCRIRLERYDLAEKALLRVVAMDVAHSAATLELASLYFLQGKTRQEGEYYGVHKNTVRSQSARALWLGVRLYDQQGNSDATASAAMALRNLYPDSAEFSAYQEQYGER